MKKLILLLLLFSSSAYAINGFLYDTCTGTNNDDIAATHSPDVGGAYAYVIGTTIQIQTNKCQIAQTRSTAIQIAANAATPPTAAYYVQGTLNASANAGASARGGVIIRRQAGADTEYICHLYGGSTGAQAMEIARRVAASNSTLNTYTADWTTGADHKIRLEVYNNASGNVVLKCFLDNILRCSYTDSTGSKITTAGTAGIELQQNGGGQTMTMDNIQADMLRTNGRRVM